MRNRMGILVVAAVLLAGPSLAFAGDMAGTGSPWAQETGYANQAKGKLVYGLKNVLFGWTELFTQPYEDAQNSENVFLGIGKGVWNGVGQTVGGALHAVTFPIPAIDVPLPEGGTHVLSS